MKKQFLLFTMLGLFSTQAMANPSIEDFLQELSQKSVSKSLNTGIIEGRIITFNTRDSEGCNAARIEMNLGEEICTYNKSSPFVSVVVMRPIEDRKEFEKKIELNNLSQKQKIALRSLADFSVMGVAAMGLIYSLPESISKWDKSIGFSGLAAHYKDRVSKGPVIDEDDWAVNYIGHPISGAYYYTMVRHQGFSVLESAAFSFCMSTFFWEYGLEAVAEIPSIQDLILTPLLGSIIGEVFYSWEKSIEFNNGKLLGSKYLGATASVLMNPAGALAKKINKIAEYKLIKDAELSFALAEPVKIYNLNSDQFYSQTQYRLQLKFKF